MKKCKLVGLGNTYSSFDKEYVNIHVLFENEKVKGCVATSYRCLVSLLPKDIEINDMIDLDSYPYRKKDGTWTEIIRSVTVSK